MKHSFEKILELYHTGFRQDDLISTTFCTSGNPHYSPIISWDENNHKLMVADVDPSLQEPYWVTIEDIFQSMSHCNPAFGIPRGWLVLLTTAVANDNCRLFFLETNNKHKPYTPVKWAA